MRIGVAWNQDDDRGFYKSIVFEEPSLAPGFYTLVKTVVDRAHDKIVVGSNRCRTVKARLLLAQARASIGLYGKAEV